MQISHHAVAESDDLPDVSTRDANTHELNAIPTHMWRRQNTPAGSGVKGREQESSVRAHGFSATLVINLVETIMIDHARAMSALILFTAVTTRRLTNAYAAAHGRYHQVNGH